MAHHLKVANPARLVAPSLSGGNGACAVGGMIMPPMGVQGDTPWHAFGDFRRETKVTRVQGGAPALEEQGLPSLQNPPGWRGGVPPQGGVGASSPRFGEQEPSLATCSRGGAAPRKSLWGKKGAQAPFSRTAAAPAVPAGRPPPPGQSG